MIILQFPFLISFISKAVSLFPKIPINKGIGESITSNKFGGKFGITVKGQDNGFIK